MLNKLILIANLCQDPELRYTPAGKAVCNLRLASSTVYKGKEGQEPREDKLFITATIWGKRAENCNEYLKKGSSVFVTGRLVTRSWEDKEGNKKSTTDMQIEEIQFLDRTREGTTIEETENGG